MLDLFNANGKLAVLYATTLHCEKSKNLLEAALSTFLDLAEGGEGKMLYSLYYEQSQEIKPSGHVLEGSLDLAFNDDMLEDVEARWKTIIRDDADETSFMKFQDREGVADDADEGY